MVGDGLSRSVIDKYAMRISDFFTKQETEMLRKLAPKRPKEKNDPRDPACGPDSTR